MVLATDMSLHFQQIKEMKRAVVTPDTLDRGSTMAFIVHAADISHPTKVWELHKKWTDGLVEEFFRQVGKIFASNINLPRSLPCFLNSRPYPN